MRAPFAVGLVLRTAVLSPLILAHALSIFTQCHTAHYHNSWARVREDVTGWLAEGVLKATEHACSSFCTGFDANWTGALRMRLAEAATRLRQMLKALENGTTAEPLPPPVPCAGCVIS